MTETPGKFVGTERRGNLDVFLDRDPRRTKISQTKRLCESGTAYRVVPGIIMWPGSRWMILWPEITTGVMGS